MAAVEVGVNAVRSMPQPGVTAGEGSGVAPAVAFRAMKKIATPPATSQKRDASERRDRDRLDRDRDRLTSCLTS